MRTASRAKAKSSTCLPCYTTHFRRPPIGPTRLDCQQRYQCLIRQCKLHQRRIFDITLTLDSTCYAIAVDLTLSVHMVLVVHPQLQPVVHARLTGPREL